MPPLPDRAVRAGHFPEINTALLFGAHPPKPLRTKFFLAQSARYEPVETAPLPEGMRLVRLDGHAFAQLGVCTPDDIWFLGDAVASEHTFDKYKLTYLYDVEKLLQTLDTVAALKGKVFIPAHVAPFEDAAPIVEAQPPLGAGDGRPHRRAAAKRRRRSKRCSKPSSTATICR